MNLRSCLLVFILLLAGCTSSEPHVVVYTSVDQVFAEPILDRFSEETGIPVRPVFDIEAAKTVGLANRIAAERARPQADVFWNNEFLQTILLAQQGLLAPSNPSNGLALAPQWRDPAHRWFASAARLRVFVTAQAHSAPLSLEDVASRRWSGSFVFALPLFGTTATHAAALRASRGAMPTDSLFASLMARSSVVDGNSVVRDLVASGAHISGLTDSDDACSAIARGAQITITPLSPPDALLIPSTVAIVRNAPHPKEAAILANWLLSAATEQALIESGASQVALHNGPTAGGCLAGVPIPSQSVSFDEIAAAAPSSRESMARLFSR